MSIGLTVVSGLWIVERLAEVELHINGAVNRVLLWPRSLYVMIAVTVVAAVYQEFESRRGRLLPVDEGAAPVTVEAEPERETTLV